VSWDARRQSDTDDWVQRLLGPEWAAKIEYQQERHCSTGATIAGTIRSIRVVTSSRVPERESSGTVLVPVPGSGRLREVELADPWEPEPPVARRSQESFDGWIVELDLD
jgi:hypothetical protein